MNQPKVNKYFSCTTRLAVSFISARFFPSGSPGSLSLRMAMRLPMSTGIKFSRESWKVDFLTQYLREVIKKNGKKAVRLTAWVDPPLPQSGQENVKIFDFDF